MTRSLDTRVGSLERLHGGADEPPIVVVINASGAGEPDVQAAIRQAFERGPGCPGFHGRHVYVVHVNGGESGGPE